MKNTNIDSINKSDTGITTSLAFVDSSINQSDVLLQGLQVDRVAMLIDQGNNLDQITQELSQYQDLESVHIISHGASGILQLGNVTLDQVALADYQPDIARWGSALSESGDLLFYGCNLAANANGTAFIEQVSQITQADVAASDDLTGSAALGGDWDLEVSTGAIASTLSVEAYDGTLPIYSGNTYQLTSGAKSWEAAQAEAQSLGGNLVAINDAAEERWLKQTFGGGERLWIGLSDRAQEGTFRWVNGDTTTYRNWAAGEPNDYKFGGAFTAGEDYSLMNWNGAGQWNDMPNRYAGTFRGIIEIEQDAPPLPSSNGDGLKAEYYDNIDFTNLRLTRTDATVDFDWRFGPPAASIGSNTFSARWTGQIEPRFSETYTFQTTTDDGVRLWVNDQLIVDKFIDQPATDHTGTITLQAGQKYDIRLEYYENGGAALSQLYWSSASQPLEIVPQSQLFTPTISDTQAPAARLSADTLSTSNGDPYEFTVTYTDGTAVDASTLDNSDIRVSGPNDFSQTAALVSLDSNDDGSPRSVTYSLSGPSGGWDTADNGTYQVRLEAGQVSDTLGNAAGESPLGSFEVAIADVVVPGVVFADDFETNRGWVTNANDSDTATAGRWEVANPEATSSNGVAQQLGSTTSGSQALVTQAAAGRRVDTYDIDNGVTSVKSPDIVLEDNVNLDLEFSYYLAHLSNATSDDFLRITVVGEQQSRAVLNERGAGRNRAGSWTAFNTDISDFSGETISLLVEAADSGSPSLVEAGVDDVVISRIGTNPPPPSGNGNGLKAEYYDNIDFTNLRLTRTDATVDFDWRFGPPAASIGSNTFSARWTGQIEPRFSETYTFQTTTDDGVRLWVNDQLIVDKFIDQPATDHTGTITLQAGQKYDIRLEYYENGGAALSQLYWSSASQPLEIVPQSQLYSDRSESNRFSLQSSETIFVNEAAGTATVTAVRTGDPQSRATLEYTTNEIGGDGAAEAGADYTVPTFDGRPNTGQIIFEPGQAEASFTIPIINDTAFEGSETFAVGLQNPSVGALGTLRTVLVTIVEDDSPAELSIDAAPVTVSETDAIATVTVQRSGDVSGSAAVDFGTSDGTASAGTDYTATSGRLTFAAGQTSQTIAVPILNDTSVESNETFAVTLSNPAGALLGSQTTTVTILNNDLELGDLTRTTAVSGLIQPTTLDWTPDGRYMLVAQKDGVVKVVDDGTLRAAPLIDISDQVNGTRGGRGLLGLAVHPDFPNTPYIYLLYTYDPPETAGNTGLAGPDGRGNRPSRMVRVSVDPGTMVADPDSLVVLAGTNSTWEYTSSPDGNSTGNTAIPPSGIIGSTVPATATIDLGNQDNDPDRPGIQNQNIRDYLATDSESHSIGDLEFGADGYLYLSNGDGTSYNFADPRTVRVQDVNNLSGKVLRIDPITGDGVASNPFYNGDVDSNASKVFYYGMRNPFRVAIDPVTDRPVIGDVGWNSFEEINTGVAGSNFGWPYLEGPNQTGSYQDLPQAISFYSNGNRNEPGDAAAVFPILSRTHGNPDRANAITVGDFYNDNTLIFGDVNGGTLYAATLDSDRQVTNVQVFDSDIPFVVDMKMGPDDRLYGVDLPSGEILRWDA